MFRTLGAWFLLAAGIVLSITIGSVWLQVEVFSPSDSANDAAAILKDDEIRDGLRDLIAGVAAGPLETTQAQLAGFLDERVLPTQAGAAVMGELVGKIERFVIGESVDPVVMTGSMLVPIVRDQRAAAVPDVIVPVRRSGTMDTTRKIVNWLIPIGSIVGLILIIAGAFLRPERQEVVRVLGESLIALAVSVLLFAYLVPAFILPTLDSNSWVEMAPRLATSGLPLVLGTMFVSGIIGIVLVLWSYTGGSTKRQWSTPLSANRYKSEGPSWS